MKKYGIDRGAYLSLQESHGGACAVCRMEQAGGLYIDHDHSTGAVRGLLCQRCNTGLGFFLDDPALLLNAINYLRRANPDFAIAA